jgi:hypothetical protein
MKQAVTDISAVLMCACVYLTGNAAFDAWPLLPFATKVMVLSGLFACVGLIIFLFANRRSEHLSLIGQTIGGIGILLLCSVTVAEMLDFI